MSPNTLLAIAIGFVVFMVSMLAFNTAIQLREARKEIEAAQGRIETIQDAKERKDEIQGLSDDDFLSRLGRWLLPDQP
jgi:cell division protein FtsB